MGTNEDIGSDGISTVEIKNHLSLNYNYLLSKNMGKNKFIKSNTLPNDIRFDEKSKQDIENVCRNWWQRQKAVEGCINQRLQIQLQLENISEISIKN